jgi:hypothetical protein
LDLFELLGYDRAPGTYRKEQPDRLTSKADESVAKESDRFNLGLCRLATKLNPCHINYLRDLMLETWQTFAYLRERNLTLPVPSDV